MAQARDFELLVLLAVLRRAEDPYANRIREELELGAGRSITRGALYRTRDRLEAKGWIRLEMEPSQVPERGGHPMRRLSVTAAGLDAVRSQRAVLQRFFAGLEPLLDAHE